MLDFDEWYRDLRPRMGDALAAWCGDVELANEALDEAFVRAVERWARLSEMASPAGWVWRTAVNVVRRRARRRSIEQRLFRNQNVDTVRWVPSDVDLWHAVDELPDRQRTATTLFYMVDMSQRDIGEAMGISEGTVAATLLQARRKLRASLRLAQDERPDRGSDYGVEQIGTE